MVQHTAICTREDLQPDAVLTIDSGQLAPGDAIVSQYAARATVGLTVVSVSPDSLVVSDFSGASIAFRPWQAGDDPKAKFAGDRSDWTVVQD